MQKFKKKLFKDKLIGSLFEGIRTFSPNKGETLKLVQKQAVLDRGQYKLFPKILES